MRKMLIGLTLIFSLAGCATTGTTPLPTPPPKPECQDAILVNQSWFSNGLADGIVTVAWAGVISGINKPEVTRSLRRAAEKCKQAVSQGDVKGGMLVLITALKDIKGAGRWLPLAVAGSNFLGRVLNVYQGIDKLHPCDQQALIEMCDELILIAG